MITASKEHSKDIGAQQFLRVKRARRRGAALLEFALVMPLLLVLGLLLVQYGIIMNATNVLTNTSREGARFAAINAFKDKKTGYTNTKSYIKEVADQTSVKYASLGDVTITAPNGVKIGEPIEVDVTYDMSRKLFLPANFWFVSVYNKSYTARTTMIIQQGGDTTNNQTFPTLTPTNTSAPTATPTPFPTATPYPPGYKTPTPVPVPTDTPTPKPTPTPKNWVAPTPVPVPTATPQPTATHTPVGYKTPTPIPTATPAPTPTRHPS